MSDSGNLDPFAILAATPGAVPLGMAAPPPAQPGDGPAAPGEPQVSPDLPEILSGANALAVAANPLLNLIPQIRVTPHHPDPAQLRSYLVDQIQLLSAGHASHRFPRKP